MGKSAVVAACFEPKFGKISELGTDSIIMRAASSLVRLSCLCRAFRQFRVLKAKRHHRNRHVLIGA